mmetsp:Transcript_29110/g.84300  ORF Transcript_29110/g.84300 Transcript_29110/m.84300 type:complete len:557 (+) Transcript_29110:117-1787(+)
MAAMRAVLLASGLSMIAAMRSFVESVLQGSWAMPDEGDGVPFTSCDIDEDAACDSLVEVFVESLADAFEEVLPHEFAEFVPRIRPRRAGTGQLAAASSPDEEEPRPRKTGGAEAVAPSSAMEAGAPGGPGPKRQRPQWRNTENIGNTGNQPAAGGHGANNPQMQQQDQGGNTVHMQQQGQGMHTAHIPQQRPAMTQAQMQQQVDAVLMRLTGGHIERVGEVNARHSGTAPHEPARAMPQDPAGRVPQRPPPRQQERTLVRQVQHQPPRGSGKLRRRNRRAAERLCERAAKKLPTRPLDDLRMVQMYVDPGRQHPVSIHTCQQGQPMQQRQPMQQVQQGQPMQQMQHMQPQPPEPNPLCQFDDWITAWSKEMIEAMEKQGMNGTWMCKLMRKSLGVWHDLRGEMTGNTSAAQQGTEIVRVRRLPNGTLVRSFQIGYEVCGLCKNPAKRNLFRTPCSHRMCRECLQQELAKQPQGTCPVCQRSLNVADALVRILAKLAGSSIVLTFVAGSVRGGPSSGIFTVFANFMKIYAGIIVCRIILDPGAPARAFKIWQDMTQK